MEGTRANERPPFKFGDKPIVGVVGAIGGGKSAVARRLAQWGGKVLDADKVGHEVLAYPEVIERLRSLFGPGVLDRKGAIDRGALAKVVFSDAARRRVLEGVVHPIMLELFRERLAQALAESETRMVVLDAAVLIEAGWDAVCDRILFVDAPRAIRLQRVRERGWSEEELARREAAQLPLDEKRARADVVLENDGGWAELDAAVDRFARELLGAAPPDAP